MANIHLTGVIHQRQSNPSACWYTCMQMMVRYHQNQAQSSLANLIPPEQVPKMQQRFAAGRNPSWAEWRNWAIELGFTPLDFTPTAGAIYDLLSKHGPIMYSGTWGQTFDGHVVIIVGIDTDNEVMAVIPPVLFVDDPVEVRAPVYSSFNFFASNMPQTLWENPLFVVR